MNNDSIKASKIIERKTKAKVVDWVPRKCSRGVRDIPIDVTALTSRPKSRQATDGIENNSATLREAAFPPVDVNESFWTEEPDVLKKKTVSSPICHSSTAFEKSLSRASAPTWKSSFLEWALTCIAS
jgi:hypothetical protein